jgi:hypothetical protein
MKAKADFALGKAALVASITFSIAAIGLGGAMLRPASREAVLAWLGPGTAYVVGQSIDVPSHWYHGSRLTLIMFARGSCQGCEKSIPVVSNVVAELRRHAGIRLVLAATGDELPVTKTLGARLGFSEPEIIPLPVADQQRMKLRVVPTILALDRQGSIRVLAEGLQQVQRSGLADELIALAGRLN